MTARGASKMLRIIQEMQLARAENPNGRFLYVNNDGVNEIVGEVEEGMVIKPIDETQSI